MKEKMGWVIDAGLSHGGVFCFCPVQGDLAGEHQIVFGMNVICDRPPHGRKLAGIIHADGQEACDRWVEENKAQLATLLEPSR
jgi:hypothetical protein